MSGLQMENLHGELTVFLHVLVLPGVEVHQLLPLPIPALFR